MIVFAEVDPARLQVRIELAQRGDLLDHGVAAVVDDDVDVRELLADAGEERGVGLVADQDGGRVVLELLAARVDVDTDDPCPGAEVVVPHLQRAAVEHADLEHHRLPAAEALEVTVVDLEVVMPLVDQPAAVGEEVLGERVGACFRAHRLRRGEAGQAFRAWCAHCFSPPSRRKP